METLERREMITHTHPVPGVQHFDPGTRVTHRIYGLGTVVMPDRYTRGDMARVRFEKCGDIRVIASSLYREK
jgi:hypothetical protein